MDKTQPYDEPLDPHWQVIGQFGPTVDELLEPNMPKRQKVIVENIVPFLTRKERALEMAANIDRAIEEGLESRFLELGAVAAAFRAFAEKTDEFNSRPEGVVRRQHGGDPKDRDGWLELYHLTWEKLRDLETEGFPLMEYAHTRQLDPPKVVGELRIKHLPDGTLVSVEHVPLPDSSSES